MTADQLLVLGLGFFAGGMCVLLGWWLGRNSL